MTGISPFHKSSGGSSGVRYVPESGFIRTLLIDQSQGRENHNAASGTTRSIAGNCQGPLLWAIRYGAAIDFPVWRDETNPLDPLLDVLGAPSNKARFEINLSRDGRLLPQLLTEFNPGKAGLPNPITWTALSLLYQAQAVIIGIGTSSLQVDSADTVFAARKALADAHLALGRKVILWGIYVRSQASDNNVTRRDKTYELARLEYNLSQDPAYRGKLFYFNPNPAWADPNSGGQEPFTNFSSDGLHLQALGAEKVGFSFFQHWVAWGFPVRQKVWRDLTTPFNASTAPYGNLLPNPSWSGTSGSMFSGVTGTAPNSYNASWSGSFGSCSAVSSRETIDGEVWQKFVITPDNTNAADYTVRIGTTNSIAIAGIPNGAFIGGGCRIRANLNLNWRGTITQLQQIAGADPQAFSYDGSTFSLGSPSRRVKFPSLTAVYEYEHINPLMVLSTNAGNLTFAVDTLIAADTATTEPLTIWLTRPWMARVEDPRPRWGITW